MTLDFEGIVKEKTGGKGLPPFVMRFLKRFLHLDFINTYVEKGDVGTDFCVGTLEYLKVKLVVEGLENVPKDHSRYTFVSNHPLGGVDGVAIAGQIGTYFGDMTMLVNDFLLAFPGLRPLCIPINKTGGQSRMLPKLISEAFDSQKHVLIFPAGLCSRLIDGKVQDLPWTKTFINQSIRTQRDIVPIHFIGENSRRFYRIARLCKFLHLKFNLAMAFLPDELYKSQGKTFTIKFGKPIPYTHFDSSRTAAEWAAWVREEVYKI